MAIFGQNWQFWEFLTYNFQTRLWIFLIYGMEVVLVVYFEEIILYMPGKFWFGEILAIKDENLAIFGQNWLFWEFLTYNFLIFGMELLWILTLSGEPIILCLVNFGTKLGLPNATEVTFSDFARKILFGRFWPILVKNGQFWQKINISANFSKSSHRFFLVLHF